MWIFSSALKLGFDLGAQPWDFMGTPTWFVSHTHLDHVAAKFPQLSIVAFRLLRPNTIPNELNHKLIDAKDIADVVLVDIIEGVPQGKTLDLMETAPVEKYDSILRGTNGYEETADSDVVVITAGLPTIAPVDRLTWGCIASTNSPRSIASPSARRISRVTWKCSGA